MASNRTVSESEEENHTNDDEVVPYIDPELLIKHPLQNRWALWYFKNDKAKDWADNLKVVAVFDTVEDFWALWNHIVPASKLVPGCDYSFFKEGIQPMWEDERNKRGGRWLINLDKRNRHSDLDGFWQDAILCLIGEGCDGYSDNICGATVNIRNKGDKLGVWTSDAQNKEANMAIGNMLKEQLQMGPKIVIGFQAHADTSSKASSTTKNRYVV